MSFRDLTWRERLLPYVWIGVMLLIVAAGFIFSRILHPPGAAGVQPATETAFAAQAIPAAAAFPSATAAQLAATEQPTPGTPTIAPTVMVDYTVKEGETLAGIAAFFKTDVFTLMALNPFVTPEFLAPGDTLVIPSIAAVPTATPEPGLETAVIEYQVAPGDTLAGIAARHGVSVQAIVQENNLTDANQIREGQTLRLRVPVTPTPSPTSTEASAG